jgi:hypothetical protein
MLPLVPTETATRKPRVWPVTAVLVVGAFLLMAYQLVQCAFLTIGVATLFLMSPFFPDVSPDPDYIAAAMACLTTLPAFAAMIWCGWQRGSRRGLLLFGLPAAVMTAVGFVLLDTPAVTSKVPQPRRSLSLADPFLDWTVVNWVVAALFVGLALVTLLLRRQARHAETGSAA